MTAWTEKDESAAVDALGRGLTDAERGRFTAYLRLLTVWQRSQRLVGSVDPSWVFVNLFADSLLFLSVLPEEVRDLLDIGSGAGFPGLPLKIVRPNMRVTLLEGHRKRASFLRAVVRELGLEMVQVVNERAEAWIPAHGGSFDAVVMRCAGPADQFLRLGEQALRPGGIAAATGPPANGAVTYGTSVTVPTGGRSARRFIIVRSTGGRRHTAT